MSEKILLYWAKQLEGKPLSIHQLIENTKWLIDKIKPEYFTDSEWHKYPDVKPEYGEDVLIFVKQGWIEIGTLYKGVFDHWDSRSIENLSINQEDITHWKETPLPPKIEKT